METSSGNSWDAIRAGVPAPTGDEEALVAAKNQIASIMGSLEAESLVAGSFQSLIPEKHRAHVLSIADEAYPDYQESFPKKDDFIEAIAFNWVGKFRTFGVLMEAAGYSAATAIPDADKNRYESGFLSRSASVVLVGAGAFSKAGTYGKYVKVPFREKSANVEDKFIKSGVFFREPPQLGHRVNAAHLADTSSAIAMFIRKVGEAEIVTQRVEATEVLSTSLVRGFAEFDRKLAERRDKDKK